MFGVPLFGGGFLFVVDFGKLSLRKGQQFFDQFSFLVKAREVFTRQKLGVQFGWLCCGKRRIEAVIITRWDWVKLMIMAFATAHRHRQE